MPVICCDNCAIESFKPLSAIGSAATVISRCRPPIRLTVLTPEISDSRLVTVSSTNHDKSSTFILSAATEYVTTGNPAVETLVMMGSLAAAGKSPRTSPTAERTSSTASWMSFSKTNSVTIVAAPVCSVVRICLTPSILVSLFSTFFAISFSSWEGAAPGKVTVTTTAGKSISGNCCTFIFIKP